MEVLPISQSHNQRIIQLVPKQCDIIYNPKLKKDGTPKKISQNKKSGRSSEVFHLEIKDMMNIVAYFKNKGQWLSYLIFVLSCNMARRVGDTMSLTWENFYNPSTGSFRADLLEIKEDKTDKLANPRINGACRDAINLYVEMTGCDPSKDNYTAPICLQLTGNYKGRVMSQSGYYKNIKKAAKDLNIEYNIGTHSPRKTFGMINRMIHPSDYDSMEILQTIFNHSDAKTTRRYIGITKQKINEYYDDMGKFFTDYIINGKEHTKVEKSPIVSLDINDLRRIIKSAYSAGIDNATETDAISHINAVSEIMEMVGACSL